MKRVLLVLGLIIAFSSSIFAITTDEFFEAAEAGNLAKVQECINSGADINAYDDYEWTALLYSTRERHTEISKFLINAKADVNVITRSGETALLFACVGGNTEIVELLINAGADVNATNFMGTNTTNLMFASQFGYTEIVKLLVNAGADINIKDRTGKTALDWADKEEIRKFLKAALTTE